VLAGTTSTHDTGLLDSLVVAFRADHPQSRVRAVAVGSGEALELGRRGDVDVLLVHAPAAEFQFVEAGHGQDRVPVMYNDFVLLGPVDDPAGVRAAGTAADALAAIARHGAPFVSRGDSSGTHEREVALWAAAGLEPGGRPLEGPAREPAVGEAAESEGVPGWYMESGQGQAESAFIASDRRAYALTDRATYTVLKDILELEVVLEGDPALLNLYSVIVSSRAAHPEAAARLAGWLTSEAGRAVIARFGQAQFGEHLYWPLVVGESLPFPLPGGSPPPSG
jgi:tungstate transport system substrate-binding protein